MSSKSFDLSFFATQGYTFGAKVHKNSLVKVKHDGKPMACKIRKLTMNDQKQKLEILTRLSHPHIIPVHSIVKHHGCSFTFLQWLDDGSLLEYIKQNGMIDETIANLWFYQMVCAVNYLHSLGYAHCNLSCESVMMTKVNNIKIAGLGYLQQPLNDLRSTHTHRKSIDAYYLAPKINRASSSDARKCDVYALGVILFIMLNAAVPFIDPDLSKLADSQMNRVFRIRQSNIHKLSVNCQVMLNTLMEPDDNIRWSLDKVLGMKWLSKYIDKHGDS